MTPDATKGAKRAADRHVPASPEQVLEQLRRKQKADRQKQAAIEKRMREREKKIAATKEEAELVARLAKAGVKLPWQVVLAADRASDAADVPETEFRAMAVVVLKKETGIPQDNIFGCDHGSVGDQPPFCHQAVTSTRGKRMIAAVHSDPWRYMNGVSWTQTTWYEKLYRVEKLSADLTDPAAHMRVCFGDLALLRDSLGVATAFERYNGSGPAAVQYRIAAMELLPWARKLVNPD